MEFSALDQDQLKDMLKAAIIEVLEERRDLVREAVKEAFEDIALARAIEEGEQSAPVQRSDILAIIDGEA